MRSVIHMLFAAVVGYILASAIMTAGNGATASLFHVSAGSVPTTRYLTANVTISFAAAMIAGYICARLAPLNGRLLALGLLVLMFLGAAIVMSRMPPGLPQPAGYLPLVTLLDIVALWAGAMMERATSRS